MLAHRASSVRSCNGARTRSSAVLPSGSLVRAQASQDAQPAMERRRVLLSTLVMTALSQLPAKAEEEEEQATAAAPTAAPSAAPTAAPSSVPGSGKRVFLDVNLEGKPMGRIVIELLPDASVGAARFRDLAEGREGLSFRRKRINGILPDHLRVEGVAALSYNSSMQSPIAGGDNLDILEQELAKQARRHDSAGLVSLIVAEAVERPIKERLVARDGKLVTVTEQAGEPPNATSFAITRGPAPSLDKTNLIVGRVVEGMDVVEAVAALPFARPREQLHDAPFMALAKSMGDKRAVTAEKGFYRPLKRVIVSDSGLLA